MLFSGRSGNLAEQVNLIRFERSHCQSTDFPTWLPVDLQKRLRIVATVVRGSRCESSTRESCTGIERKHMKLV